MKIKIEKHVYIFFIVLFLNSSCTTKKKAFNGKANLNCPKYETVTKDLKKQTKYELVLLKNGKRIRKNKRGKSKLFKF